MLGRTSIQRRVQGASFEGSSGGGKWLPRTFNVGWGLGACKQVRKPRASIIEKKKEYKKRKLLRCGSNSRSPKPKKSQVQK